MLEAPIAVVAVGSSSGRRRVAAAASGPAAMSTSPSLGASLRVLSGAAPSSLSSRPSMLKRTNSTASVNERVMDMLNPMHKDRYVGSDEEGSEIDESDMGMQEDWEPEPEEEDPFAPSGSGSSSARHSSGSRMMLDNDGSSLPSSPTLGRSSLPTPKSSRKTGKSVSMRGMEDDEDDNPFLSRGPPKAPSKKGKTTVDRDKVSYVFRGKRITYNASIDSMFPAEYDNDGVTAANYKSGPRVLFPYPPTPSASEKPLQPPTNVSPPTTVPNATLLMQTPRRKAAPPAEFSTPAERIAAALSGDRKGAKKDYDPASYIPPTPASLPQKSKAEREIERERLQGAMRGLQASHAASSAAHRGESSEARVRRYAPYPPR